MPLAARRGVQHLLESFVHHVAVALQREHDRVGKHALHAGRDRRRAAVQRLHEVDVHRAAEARVAADAGDADRALRDAELDEGLEEPAHRDRLAAAGTHVVLLGEQEVGEQRLDDARAVGRGRRVEDRAERVRVVVTVSAPPGAVRARSGTRRCRGSRRAACPVCSARMRSSITSTSSRRPTPKPEPSVETPPMNSTGAWPAAPMRTSSIICPAHSSNEPIDVARPPRRRARCRTGTATA